MIKGKRVRPTAASKKSGPSRTERGRDRGQQPAYQRGKKTRDAIVAAAETILVRHGHSGFTIKRVADCAGIAVGNLSYHFPTKDLLLELLVDQTLAEYSRRFDALSMNGHKSEVAVLAELVDWFLDDSTSDRYTHLFRELWAAALHSPSLNLALQRFYDQSIADVLALIANATGQKNVRPDLRLIVYLLCVLSEGSSVLFGSRARSSKLYADLKRVASRAITLLAESEAPSRPAQ